MLQYIQYYGELVTSNDKIFNLGEIFNYYYADNLNVRVSSKNLIKIDIKSAFPTICELMFGSNSNFILELKTIEDKLERNIFISNTLKDIPDKNYLLELNNYCKIVIMSYIFNYYDDIFIFEYQKDGVLFSGTKTFSKIKEFDKLINSQFEFHIDIIEKYIRFNKTSLIYDNNNNLHIKGGYKDPPLTLVNVLKELFQDSDSKINLDYLLNIYSKEYFEYIYNLKMIDEINNYFKFNKKYFLDIYGNKVLDINKCHYRAPLKYFLYPVLGMLKE